MTDIQSINPNISDNAESLFCPICASLLKRTLTNNYCDICGYTKDLQMDVYYSENIGDEKPDYHISINIIYDFTLPRVFLQCDICKDIKEFIIYQKNPSKYITNKICTGCLNKI